MGVSVPTERPQWCLTEEEEREEDQGGGMDEEAAMAAGAGKRRKRKEFQNEVGQSLQDTSQDVVWSRRQWCHAGSHMAIT